MDQFQRTLEGKRDHFLVAGHTVVIHHPLNLPQYGQIIIAYSDSNHLRAPFFGMKLNLSIAEKSIK